MTRVAFSLLTLSPGHVGGSETYVRGLLDEFRGAAGKDRILVLATPEVMGAYRDRAGGAVELTPVRSFRLGRRGVTRAAGMAVAAIAPRLVARGVPADRFDVLHLPLTVPVPVVDRPTVVTVHETQVYERGAEMSALERRYRGWAYHGSARRADTVVAVSAYVRDRLVTLGGIAPERVEVIHLGIDHARFRPGPPDGGDAALLPPGLPDRFVVYPANLWAHKNHTALIDALAKTEDRRLALVLAGRDYGRRDELLAHARRRGVADRVVLVGHVDADRVAALYRRAEALVFPSLYEGFGAPPLEAMACGCPVASSTVTSLAEVVGDAALAFDPRDPDDIAAALDRITADGPLRARLREAGLARARAFSWKRCAERHLELYRRVAP
jgi:glycosyltransferase involved in cell wall biosynthesis